MIDDDDGDSEYWRAWKDDARKRAKARGDRALELLRACALASFLAYRPTSVLLRHPKVSADFFPTTGRWREVGRATRTYEGGVDSFLGWAAKRIGATS